MIPLKATLSFVFIIGYIYCNAQRTEIALKDVPKSIIEKKDSLFSGSEIVKIWSNGDGNYEIKHHYDSLIFITSHIDKNEVWLSMQPIDFKNIPFTILRNPRFPLLYLDTKNDKIFLVQTSNGTTFYRLFKTESVTGKSSKKQKQTIIDFNMKGELFEKFVTY